MLENAYYFNEKVSKAMVKSLVHSGQIKPSFNKTTLTERETEIVILMSREFTSKEIADKLGITLSTVNGHRERIVQKTKSKNLVGIIMYAIRHSII